MANQALLNLAVALVAACLLLALVGALYQVAATRLDERKYPPPGRLVDVGGYRLHINCSGPEGVSVGPTVVMDAGIGDCSLSWSLVQPLIASFGSVCTYDRAGMGWSDPASTTTARTSQQMVEDLHALLNNAGIRGPYVLVGHSFGGLNALLYASQYPEEVAGMVLVDSAHGDHAVRLPLLLRVGLLTAPLGIARLFAPILSHPIFVRDSKYPSAYKAVVLRTKHLNASRREWAAVEESWRQARTSVKSLGDKPLVVLTAGHEEWLKTASRKEVEFWTGWKERQKELAHRSSRGRLIIVENSGHYIQYDRPELVVDAVREAVEAVRCTAVGV